MLNEELAFVKKEQSKQYIGVTGEQLRQQVPEIPHGKYDIQQHTTDELADEMN